MSLDKLRRDAHEIFKAGLLAVDPEHAVRNAVKYEKNNLIINQKIYDLNHYENIYLVGAGKAGASMAAAIENILADKITQGIVNVKYGHTKKLNRTVVNEAAHPVPDKNGQEGTQNIIDLLKKVQKQDLVLCLLSGGGSALLPGPVKGITLSEIQEVTKALLACGASIHEINTIRKHISMIKGGQMARLAYPATLVSLILSDVIGNDLDVIASGPTVPDTSTFSDAKNILLYYKLWDKIPPAVRKYLDHGVQGKVPETPKKEDEAFKKTYNVIVASNNQAIFSARQKAEQLGYNVLVLSSFIEGETKDVGRVHASLAKEILHSGNPIPRPACIISGGETTVTLKGKGKGGRNQEFVLSAAIDITGLESVVILSGGTDGTDGPTDAAGAICDDQTLSRAEVLNLNAKDHLLNNNAYPFFQKLSDLIITGPTHTNVMDLRLVMVGKE